MPDNTCEHDAPNRPTETPPVVTCWPNSPSPRRRSVGRGSSPLVVLLAGAPATGTGRGETLPTPGATKGRRPDASSARALPVVAVPARKGSIDVYLNALGTVTPRNMVTVRRASTVS